MDSFFVFYTAVIGGKRVSDISVSQNRVFFHAKLHEYFAYSCPYGKHRNYYTVFFRVCKAFA